MPIVKFECNPDWGWSADIKRIECERESESCVWINGRRRLKCDRLFDTWDAAKQAIVEARLVDVDRARRSLETAQSQLNKAASLAKPAGI